MKSKPSFLLLISLTLCIVSSSEGYGANKFSQSFSSSSASSHASSYSSSSSYSFNNGHNPGQLGFIHDIPKAKAVAAASATAGFATASANAAASAGGDANSISHGTAVNQQVPNTASASGGYSGSGSYSAGGSNFGAATNSKENIEGGAYPGTHRTHQTIPATYQAQDGSKSVGHHYSSASSSAHASAGSYSYSESQGSPNVIGPNSHSAEGSGPRQHGPVLFKPHGNDDGSTGGSILSKPSVSNVQYNKGVDTQLSPNKIDNIGHVGGGSESASQSNSYSNTHGITSSGYSPVGQNALKDINENSGDNTPTHNHVIPNKIGGYSHSGSGSYSSQGSSSGSTQNSHVNTYGSTNAPTPATYATSGNGGQVQDGSYSIGPYNSPKQNEDDGSYKPDKTPNNQDIGSGSYFIGGNNAATKTDAASHAVHQYNDGSYNTAGTGNVGSGTSYSTVGSKGSATGQTDYSFEKKYFQPVVHSQTDVYAKDVNSKPHNHKFPGPDGSIYDYKVPSLQGNSHTAQSSVAQSGSYGGTKPIISSSNTVSNKNCCKGPFPGPSGSIYDSKPAYEVGTAVKTSVSHPPLTRVTPKTPTINDFPGSPGSIYTSKPVLTNNANTNHQSNNKWSTSAPSGTYQTQFGSSSSPVPLCTTSSPCTKVPKQAQQTTPSSYLNPPVVQYKPVIETVKEVPKQNGYNSPQHQISVETIPEDNRQPQIQDTTSVPTKTTSSQIGYVISGSERNAKSGFSTAASHSHGSSTSVVSSQSKIDVNSQIPKQYLDAPKFVNVNDDFKFPKTSSSIIGEGVNHEESTIGALGKTGPQELPQGSPRDQIYNVDNINSNTGPLLPKPTITEGSIQHTSHQSTPSATYPVHQYSGVGGQVQPDIKVTQNSFGSFSNQGASSYSSSSKATSSTSSKTISGDSEVGSKPIDVSTTIEEQVPRVHTNSDQEIIIEPVRVSTTIEKQVPRVHTQGYADIITKPAAVPTYFEKDNPKTYTSTLYIDIKKPSGPIDSGSIIFEKPGSFDFDKNMFHFVGGGSHGYNADHGVVGSGVAFSSAGSNSYGSSSRGFAGTSKHGCGNPNCGTSYRPYSNAVPSHGYKTMIGVGGVPSSGYFGSQSGSGASVGSYESKAGGNDFGGQVGSGGYSSSGSYGGVFPKKHISSDDGSGGFLSSIYSHNHPVHSAHAGSHAKAGSFSSSSSYSKANSYASSSSFASSSSGSYSSHHY